MNPTVIRHDADAATLLPQVLVSVNELALVPVTLMPVTDSVVVPLFVNMICCVGAETPTAVEGKERLAGDRLTAVPAPTSETVCGDPTAPSAMLTEAV